MIMINLPKTYEEHRQYLHDIVRLKLWYLHTYLTRNPGADFREALRDRVDIYRKTDCNRYLLNPTPEQQEFDAAPWQKLENALLATFEKNRNNPDAFEHEGFAILKDSIERRAPRDYIDVSRIDGYQCGSLRYQLPPLGSTKLIFHIANAIQPQSFFADPEYLPMCFAELLRQGEMLGYTEITCTSWLNSLPKWLNLFPEEYRASLGEPNRDIRWHYGFWGQFITARGTFNAQYAKQFRDTGEMPYYPRNGYCSIAAFRKHLGLD